MTPGESEGPPKRLRQGKRERWVAVEVEKDKRGLEVKKTGAERATYAVKT